MIYFIALLILVIPVFRFDLMKIEGNRKLWLVLEYIILVAIAAFRYRVGGDTLIYMDLFEDYPTIGELTTFDYESAVYNPMWYVYNSVFKTFGDSFALFQLVHAIIVNTVFLKFFKRYTDFYFSAILIYYIGYYFYFNMEVLREVLCVSIMLWAFPYLQEKKFIRYYLFCFLALSIHMSAALMFLLPLMLLFKKDSFWFSLFVIVAIVVLLKVVDIITIVLSLAFEGQLAASIKAYMDLEAPNMIGAMVQFLICVPFVILMFVRNWYHFENDNLMGAFMMVVVAIQTFGMFIPAFPRFSNYLLPFGIVYIVNTFYLNYWEIRSHHLATILVSSALCIYMFNLTYFYLKNKSEDLKGAHVYNRYLPYHTIFDPQSDKTREQLLLNERANSSTFGN